MQEIKLHNAETQHRWNWEYLQAKLFKLNLKTLRLNQIQMIGGAFINNGKNMFLSFLTAKLVIQGEITLGMMMSVSYIIGQLNSPIEAFIDLINTILNAHIALERLSTIHNKEEEINSNIKKITFLPKESQNLQLTNLNFRYPGSLENVLNDINLIIPIEKTTAIVGASGSGKTTLMKLLLKFYKPTKGNIKFGNIDLGIINEKTWRNYCGVVLQEGYIFNDTIANNIAIGESVIDQEKLLHAVKISCIKDFIETLPLAYNTIIGNEGMGLSTGQKQRILIARAIYKSPKIIFFDEATSALDTKNEYSVMKNLNSFFKKRTSIIIAHRLSTVQNADKIIVLDQGKIIENGTHLELVNKKGKYFKLIQNQLQLENLEIF